MAKPPKPPKTYVEFVRQFPKLDVAWRAMSDAESEGPIDERARRLIKLAISIGAMREGAVHSNVRKALAQGITREELKPLDALAASNICMPATVAIYTWIRDVTEAPPIEGT
ncbi:MAG: carboxymuconolactone decarboxylase family protein [bacterium]|nr:carboxymuconolactone decarboxylase family protein [Candidatus Kapabacteria bacterium]